MYADVDLNYPLGTICRQRYFLLHSDGEHTADDDCYVYVVIPVFARK